jgi:CheY-like chemotaxis protein
MLHGRVTRMRGTAACERERGYAPRIKGGPLVLIVDDDPDSRATARMVLEDEGYTVDVASNGQMALERLRSLPRPTLMLVDLMMPVMDGPTLLVALEASAEHSRIPVVVMTASGPDSRTSGLRYPVLRKPFGLDDLMRLVTECAPRLWDDEEPTDETQVSDGQAAPAKRTTEDATPRVGCVACEVAASARCVGCGEAFCRRCIDAGPEGRCPRCRRRDGDARTTG